MEGDRYSIPIPIHSTSETKMDDLPSSQRRGARAPETGGRSDRPGERARSRTVNTPCVGCKSNTRRHRLPNWGRLDHVPLFSSFPDRRTAPHPSPPARASAVAPHRDARQHGGWPGRGLCERSNSPAACRVESKVATESIPGPSKSGGFAP